MFMAELLFLFLAYDSSNTFCDLLEEPNPLVGYHWNKLLKCKMFT